MIVTGASRGLGRALAEGFGQEGARVVVTATSLPRLDATLERLRGRGVEAHGIALELSDPESVTAAAAEALGVLGRVDVLVNNAGVFGVLRPLADYPVDVWREVIEVNLTGTFALTRGVLGGMADEGSIINVSSSAAGRPGRGAYGVSKLGLEGMTAMLREELADRRIRCVAVNPGPLRTEMRAEAHPDEDPATVPHPSSVVEVFLAIAAGADPGPLVDATQWSGR